MQTRAKVAEASTTFSEPGNHPTQHGCPENNDSRNAHGAIEHSCCPSGGEKVLEAQKKVLPRLRAQRTTLSRSKTAVDSIKTEMKALKDQRQKQELASPDARKGTPTRPPPVRRVTLPAMDIQPKTALPLKYSQLLECFKHLQMVYRMRKTKSVFLTFADAKASIQKASRRTFSIKHLAKIKYMIPEILQWQYMEGNTDTLASDRLVISLEMQPVVDHAGMDDAAMYSELRERLLRHARRAALIGKENEEIPEAELPDPSLSVLVSATKALSGRSWSNSSSGYISKSPSSVKPRRRVHSLTPSKRLESPSTFQSPRRLTTVTEATLEGGGETSWSKPRTPQSSVLSSFFSPCSHNRGAMRESFKRRMLMSPSKVKERARSQALANLVTALNDVRAVFHRFKTTKRPLKDVLQAMQSHTKSRYTEEAAQLHLQLLLEHAPQFVRLECESEGKEVVSIDRECNVSAIKEMLKEIAEKRPKVDVTEAEVEKRISEFDGLDFLDL